LYHTILGIDLMVLLIDAPIVHNINKVNLHMSQRFLQNEGRQFNVGNKYIGKNHCKKARKRW
jgi:hypothetical protein